MFPLCVGFVFLYCQPTSYFLFAGLNMWAFWAVVWWGNILWWGAGFGGVLLGKGNHLH
jgi:hypothetical protein